MIKDTDIFKFMGAGSIGIAIGLVAYRYVDIDFFWMYFGLMFFAGIIFWFVGKSIDFKITQNRDNGNK